MPRADSVKLADIIIRETPVTVFVHAGGNFYIEDEHGQQLGYGSTLDAAKKSASVELGKKKVTVEVPFVTAEGGRGIATSIHAGTGNVTARVPRRYGSGTEKVQIDRHAQTYKDGTTQEQIDEYKRLRRVAQLATNEAREYVEKIEVDLNWAVRSAIAAKASEEAEADA